MNVTEHFDIVYVEVIKVFEGVIYGVLTALVLLGVVSISYYIMLRILHPKTAGKYIIVISADSDARNVASQLYAEKLRVGLLGDKGCVIALDCGMDENERVVCTGMCNGSEGIYVCTPEKLSELLFKEVL